MNFNIFGNEITVKKPVLIALSAVLIVVLGFVGIYVTRDNNGIVFDDTDGKENIGNTVNVTAASKATPDVTPVSINQPEEIKVYITGCVKKPGIVTLKKGQLIDDAIKAAGGPTQDADLNINMVYELNENAWIIIKSKSENMRDTTNKSNTSNTSSGMTKSPAQKDQNKSSVGNTGIEIIKDSGGAVVEEKSDPTNGSDGKININTASSAELDKLPGIGEKISKDIVSYRDKNGKFKSIADIVKVPGVGESKFNNIKDKITVN